MKKSLVLIMAIGLLAPLTGCWELEREPTSVWGDETRWGVDADYEDYDPALGGLVEARGAALRGDLGEVLGFAVEPGAVEGFRDGFGLTRLTIEATTDTGALVMAITQFDARILEQEPGVTTTYTPFSAPYDAPFMEVTGCSGTNGEIDFDITADEVEVTVVPSATNPDLLTVRFVARFSSDLGNQETEGSFDIEVPGGQTGTTAPGL